MTFSNEIQQTKEDIALLQEKLKKLEEMEKHKSPVEEAYKRVYGWYPDTGICNGMSYVWWDVFCKGYNASKEDCKVEEEPTPSIINCTCEGTPPVGCSSWTEWFELLGSKGILYGLKISSLSNKVEEPKPKPETLYDLIGNWWDNVFVVHDACNNETAIDYLVNDIEKWLPDEFDPNDSVYEYEIGWNEAIQAIKEKLR
jgi:hypothetical protein